MPSSKHAVIHGTGEESFGTAMLHGEAPVMGGEPKLTTGTRCGNCRHQELRLDLMANQMLRVTGRVQNLCSSSPRIHQFARHQKQPTSWGSLLDGGALRWRKMSRDLPTTTEPDLHQYRPGEAPGRACGGPFLVHNREEPLNQTN